MKHHVAGLFFDETRCFENIRLVSVALADDGALGVRVVAEAIVESLVELGRLFHQTIGRAAFILNLDRRAVLPGCRHAVNVNKPSKNPERVLVGFAENGRAGEPDLHGVRQCRHHVGMKIACLRTVAFVNEQNDPLRLVESLHLALKLRDREPESSRDLLNSSIKLAPSGFGVAVMEFCFRTARFVGRQHPFPVLVIRQLRRFFPHVSGHFGSDRFLLQVNIPIFLHHAENKVRAILAKNALNDFDLRKVLFPLLV